MSTNAFDSEVERLLKAAIQDLGCAGVVLPAEATELAAQACITYFLANFGEPDRYEDLKRSYDEQKAQLRTRTGYTIWTTTDDESGGSLDIEADGETVTTSGAAILAAYDAGQTLRLTLNGMTMTATATGMSGGVLTADFRDGLTVYRLTTDGNTVTLKKWTLATVDEDESEEAELYIVNLGALSADGGTYAVTNSPADIMAAYNSNKLIVCRLELSGTRTDYYPYDARLQGNNLLWVDTYDVAAEGRHRLVVNTTENIAEFLLYPVD